MRHPWLRHAAWLAPLLVVAAGHGAALSAGFVSDDYEFLKSARDAPDALAALRARTLWDRDWFRPLGLGTFWAQMQVWGASAAAFHALQLVVHAAGALLLGRLVARLGGGELAALIAATLYAAQPVQCEAVTWVSGRFDGLAACFTLAALVAWLRHVERPSAAALALTLVCALAACASKESGMLLPLGLAAATYVARARVTRRLALAWIAVAALCAGWALWRASMLAQAEPVASGGARFGFGPELLRAPRYAAQAALACFLPMTDRTDAALRAVPTIVFALSVAAAAVLAARTADARAVLCRASSFAALFALAILPYAAFGARLHADLEGSRYLLLASAFACAALAQPFAAALQDGSRGARRLATLALALAVAASAAATSERTARWVEAGRQARKIVATFPACDAAEPVHVAGLPDRVGGAYVFRNAFPHALQVERGCRARVVRDPAPAGALALRWDAARETWAAAVPR